MTGSSRPATGRLRPAYAPGEDRNTIASSRSSRSARLRPAYAPGEDRNVTGALGRGLVAVQLRPAYAPGEDRNEGGGRAHVGAVRSLRPAYAPGEDRNSNPGLGLSKRIRLRPAYAPGEDRNQPVDDPRDLLHVQALRPAYAPGEDRNHLPCVPHASPNDGAAPGLRAGRGSQHRVAGHQIPSRCSSCARPTRRARIATDGQYEVLHRRTFTLRPAYAPGEDRNSGARVIDGSNQKWLRPAYAPGEDRNNRSR